MGRSGGQRIRRDAWGKVGGRGESGKGEGGEGRERGDDGEGKNSP